MSAVNDGNVDGQGRLLSLEFLVLFFQATCCNCYIAVFYCMEQWMVRLAIVPETRGFLLAVLAATVFLARPTTTWRLYGRNKTWPLILSIITSSLTLLCYPLIEAETAVIAIFSLRLIQGIALAVYSSATVTLLVDCIPKGQSARGFALFSLTLLLPYAVIPAIGEELIGLVGGEARLFAATSLLGLPALASLPLLKKSLAKGAFPERSAQKKTRINMWQSLHPKDLGLVYFACMTFSIMTNEAIFFMKGLCQIIAATPAYFFTTYTTTIMLIRLIGNAFFDRFPRYPVTIVCSAMLALSTAAMAYCNGKALILLSILYGFGLGLLYPLLAAIVCDRSTPSLRSLNSNIMMTCFDLSGFLAPIIGGLVVNAGGYRAVFISTSVSVSLCGLSMLLDAYIQKGRSKA